MDGTFGHGVQVCPPAEPGHRVFCIQVRRWIEMHPVDYVAMFPAPTHEDRFEVIALAGEVRHSISLPPKPSPNAHLVYREIDSRFMLLRSGEPAAKDVTIAADGIFVHIKLDALSGITCRLPKVLRRLPRGVAAVRERTIGLERRRVDRLAACYSQLDHGIDELEDEAEHLELSVQALDRLAGKTIQRLAATAD